MNAKERCKMKHYLFLQSIDDLYRKMCNEIGKVKVWSLNNDELCDEIEDYVKGQFKRWCKQEDDKNVSNEKRG